MARHALRPSQLRRRCPQSLLKFSSTARLRAPTEVVGQQRAVAALEVGMGIGHSGYNLFVLGPPGHGRHTVTMTHVRRIAALQPVPDEWCYVHNFELPRMPRALCLPAGTIKTFVAEMDALVQEIKSAIIAALEGDAYRGQRDAIEQGHKKRHEKSIEAIQKRAKKRGIALIHTGAGIGFAPTRKGEVMSPEQYSKLDPKRQKVVEAAVSQLQQELQETMSKLPGRVRASHRAVKQLNKEVVTSAVEEPIDEVCRRYSKLPSIVAHLKALKADVIEHAAAFISSSTGEGGEGESRADAMTFERYRVNPMTDHAGLEGAPVIYEDHPSYHNLLGQVEYQSRDNALTTDFSLIKPGALQRANGGYLILDARRILSQPYAYEALKQALRGRQIRIQSIGQQLSLISTVSLEPAPIPLDVKVILIGERQLYYRLCQLDPEFPVLFKIAADFEESIEWTDASVALYARLLASLAARDSLLPLKRAAVALVIEYGSRLAGDSQKLSVGLESLADVLREADYCARQAQKRLIDRIHVQQAIGAAAYRNGRIRERMLDQVLRQTMLIDTAGSAVGQVNGLAVVQLGNYRFGRPSRITASVRLGKGEVIDIEREAKLGGPLHSKGVMILGGLLGERFGQERPLALSARLVFEQSYGGVDGDSASSAEFYALLSSLADIPLRQSIAVTGAVNQRGEVQAIGGISEKIEGFFDLCLARGLNGEQGVLMPAANVKHLMLKEPVVEAVRRGEFNVFAVDHVDRGIEVLTGVPAGARGPDGYFPRDSINARVEERLAHYADRARAPGGRRLSDGARPPLVERAAAEGPPSEESSNT